MVVKKNGRCLNLVIQIEFKLVTVCFKSVHTVQFIIVLTIVLVRLYEYDPSYKPCHTEISIVINVSQDALKTDTQEESSWFFCHQSVTGLMTASCIYMWNLNGSWQSKNKKSLALIMLNILH